MAVSTLTSGRLRRLAEIRPEHGRVLSVYLNLDPSQFATAPARATAVTSLLNRAAACIGEARGLDRDEVAGAKEDIERVKEVLSDSSLAGEGTHGVAVFACGAADLLEVVRLPHAIESRVVVERRPYIEPLAMMGDAERERWAVLLVNTRVGRLFEGSKGSLHEVARIEDDVQAGGTAGGTAERQSERSQGKDRTDHLQRVADELFEEFKRRPFDRLLIGGPDEHVPAMEGVLHPYLRERCAGKVSIDVDNTSTKQVEEAVAPIFDEDQRKRERATLDRFAEGVGRGGRAAAGLADVLTALNEQRVEQLLFEEGFRSAGWQDPETGMLAANASDLPGAAEHHDDVIELAVERAIEQRSKILVIRRYPDLGAHGGVGAILRF